MEMKQRDEAKRSKLWAVVMLASSAIILLLIAFFITKSVTGNPLKGEWVEEEKGYHLDVEDDEVTIEATIDGQFVEVDLYYELNKTDKIITLKSSTAAYSEAADETDGKLSASEIDEAMEEFVDTYDYSIEGGKLVLSEREFGNEFVFTRVEK